MSIRPIFAWYDFWVGLFWDRHKRRLYVLPVPCFGIVIQLRETWEPAYDPKDPGKEYAVHRRNSWTGEVQMDYGKGWVTLHSDHWEKYKPKPAPQHPERMEER